VDRVERQLRDVEEDVVVRAVGLREGVDPRALDRGDPAERPQDRPSRERRGSVGEVAVRNLSVVVGREEEVLAARAVVGTGDPHVDDVAEPEVVDHAQRLRRRLDDRRPPGAQVEERRAVGRLGVRRQEQRARVRARIGVADDLRRCDPDRPQAAAHGDQRRSRKSVEEHLDAPHQIEGVVDLGRRLGRRHPVEEVQRAERRLDPVGGGQRRDRLPHPLRRQAPSRCCGHHVLLVLVDAPNLGANVHALVTRGR
jgi:hypothetical protein